MLRETRRAIRYHHPLPNLKLMPARRMFSLSETVVLVPPQLVKPQDALARSTNRYSALAVQFGAKAYSRPTPAVQPASVELMNGNVPAAAWTLANAAPAVP